MTMTDIVGVFHFPHLFVCEVHRSHRKFSPIHAHPRSILHCMCLCVRRMVFDVRVDGRVDFYSDSDGRR